MLLCPTAHYHLQQWDELRQQEGGYLLCQNKRDSVLISLWDERPSSRSMFICRHCARKRSIGIRTPLKFDTQDKYEERQRHATVQIVAYQQQIKVVHHKKVKAREFQIGDLVLKPSSEVLRRKV